jgi:hypothetical protein
MESDESTPEVVPLDEPRDLSAGERALLDRLLTGSAATDELREQAKTARVVGTCSCGCPSVTLEVASTAPPARWTEPHPDVRHGQDASIYAEAMNSEGRTLDVVLHSIDGRLTELEIWAQGDDKGPQVTLPDASSLRF